MRTKGPAGVCLTVRWGEHQVRGSDRGTAKAHPGKQQRYLRPELRNQWFRWIWVSGQAKGPDRVLLVTLRRTHFIQ